jgi:hypothetical protein
MKHLRALHPGLAASLFALVLCFVVGNVSPARARGGQSSVADLRIAMSVGELEALTGDTLTFTSTITNAGSTASPTLIVSLNFVAVDHSTYVDPEDWSSARTTTVPPLAAGASATSTWTVTTVTKGDVDAFVVALPDTGQATAAEPLIASPAVHLHVNEQRKLNPGGVLPVVIAVPGLIAAAFAGLQVSRRRG